MTSPDSHAPGVSGRRLSSWLLAAGLAVAQAACGGTGSTAPVEEFVPGVDEAGVLAPGELVKVNFQPDTAPVPTDYLKDIGAAFTTTRGYGWVARDEIGNPPLDLTPNTRDRALVGPRLGTFIHMQGMDVPGAGLVTTPARWEYVIANGTYTVLVAVGDAGGATDSVHRINVEGQLTVDDFVPTADRKFRTASRIVTVTDGKLSIDARGGTNTKLAYVDISVGNRPSVRTLDPNDGELDVLPTSSLVASLNLPASGVNAATLSTSTVILTELNTGATVSGTVITSGGGDVINFTPNAPLKGLTRYRLRVTSGVEDLSGNDFLPFQADFTTAPGGGDGGTIAFDQVRMSATHGEPYTSIAYGPDGRVYAGTLTGEIARYTVNTDGTLGGKTLLNTVRAGNGNVNRYVIGLAFDPASTSTSPVLWVSHSEYWNGVTNANDWTGKISRLSGTNLGTYQDYVVGLPRSSRDHVINSITFKPGENGVLYAVQGSNSAMGAPDTQWGNRPERVLTAAVLRINLAGITSPPLNVKSEEGGTYNPYATNAPVTVFASGVRNAYDLAWHSNGNLYVPTNGSAAGGNTPSTPALPTTCVNGSYSGPAVTGVTNVTSTQPDLLFRIQQGKYFGHPNPRRCEYVLNGGNPTSGVDPLQVSQYAVGTQPDVDWLQPAFNFELNKSPNGVLEYKNTTAVGGQLAGKLLVVRYSGGKDIVALTPSATTGNITASQTGITGFTNFNGTGDPIQGSPLDLTQNPANGFLYVTELDEVNGTGEIILLKPRP